MKMTPNPTNTETKEMEQLATAPLLAFIFSKCGEEGLRQLLAPWTEPESNPGTASAYGKREILEDCAAELEERGLSQAASIIADIAQQCPSGLDNVPDYYRSSFGEEADDLWRNKWLQRRKREIELSEGRSSHKGPSLADYRRVKPMKRAEC